MFQQKVDKYAPFMDGNTFVYRPLAFSCYGRVHLEAEAILKLVAQAAARRRGIADHTILLRRLHRNIGVEVWRRGTCMVLACLPKLSDGEDQLLDGSTDSSILHG